MTCFIIAEAGVNHNGREDFALALIETAARAGADAVKFQTFRAESLCLPGTEKADYQKTQTGSDDQFDMLRALELPWNTYTRLMARCTELGIEFMSTAFDEEAMDNLVALGMRRIKIPSGEITNHPLLRHAACKHLPIILSTGMATLEEVQEAVEVIRNALQNSGDTHELKEMLTVLHCTSNYPTAAEDVNLQAMRTLADATDLAVGYSDHTQGTLIAPVAVAMGAVVIEKHFTLDRDLPGPDHKASLTPEELTHMVADIRCVERAMGDGNKAPRDSELPVRSLVRRSLTLRRAIVRGEIIVAEDISLLRPAGGIEPKHLDTVIGKKASLDLPSGHQLQWSDIAI